MRADRILTNVKLVSFFILNTFVFDLGLKKVHKQVPWNADHDCHSENDPHFEWFAKSRQQRVLVHVVIILFVATFPVRVGWNESADRNYCHKGEELGWPPHKHQVQISLQPTTLSDFGRRYPIQFGQPPEITRLRLWVLDDLLGFCRAQFSILWLCDGEQLLFGQIFEAETLEHLFHFILPSHLLFILSLITDKAEA